VIKIKTFDEAEAVPRELMLVKVRYNRSNRSEIMEIASAMKADIVDMSQNQMMLQICDRPGRIETLIKLLKGVSIVEIARTGTLALPRCAE
jgi:acetolactate synthase-1/3 small subunit